MVGDTEGQGVSLSVNPSAQNFSHYMMEAERLYLEEVLALTGNNKSEAAKIAGISRSQFNSKISRYTVKTRVTLS